jgi:ABC-type phosphate/phosphonate transport system substrate-binding protein
MLIGNARLYSSIAPTAALAWRRLLGVVAAQSGVALDIIDHAYPAALDELWVRPDLGCAFMCGWPFAREGAVKRVIAAPVPAAGWCAGRAVYRSEFVAAADAPFQTLADTFGERFAYNARDSHSGYNMPRAHLARWASRQPLFRAVIGPTGSHRRSIEAVLAGAAELAAIDSYYLALAHRHAPELVAGLRVVDVTDASPIPLLVGSSALKLDEARRLANVLVALGERDDARSLLGELSLEGFAEAEAAVYAATLALERAAERAGYGEIR